MNQSIKHEENFISDNRSIGEASLPLAMEGFLGMFGICLPKFREKKIGTSVKEITSPIYTASLSPPPIRPMVENSPLYELHAIKDEAQNLMEECA